MLIAVGNDHINNTSFVCPIPTELTLEILAMFELRADCAAQELMEAHLDRVQLRVVDAMAWEDTWVADRVADSDRFAIRTNEVEFGIGVNEHEAREALRLEEF